MPVDESQRCTVIIQPSGRRGYIDIGKTIKEASIELGVDIEGICGEKATCGKCRVKINEGYFEKYGIESHMENLSPTLESEQKFLNDSLKLALESMGKVMNSLGLQFRRRV